MQIIIVVKSFHAIMQLRTARQEVSSGHSDAANVTLVANMLARMVVATQLQFRRLQT